MNLTLAVWVVYAIYLYVLIGLLLLPWWHLRGLRELDEVAATGPWGFRLLISFGLVALWPAMLRRARRAHGEPVPEHNPHRDRACPEVQR